MFIWDFVLGDVMDQLIDWLYTQLVGFLGSFFTQMGNMGIELFDMSWVQSIVLFFSYLAWALYVTGLVVSVFEELVQADYRAMRCNGLCGYSKTQRIMHANGIKAEIKSKYKPQTTKVDPNEQAFPNLMNQQSNVQEFNKAWLADITYIRVNGSWNYLAAVMDLGRRKIVGWAMGTSPMPLWPAKHSRRHC